MRPAQSHVPPDDLRRMPEVAVQIAAVVAWLAHGRDRI
jgi:hypothetical protein